MIILETIIFILLSSILFISSAGYGKTIFQRYSSNIILSFFLGLIILSLLLTSLHFLMKINIYINFFVILIGLILFLNKTKLLSLRIVKKEKFIFFLVLTLLIPIFLTQKYHEDFGYYHLPYLISFAEQKIIFGLANSNLAYTHNSLWLNVMGILFLPNNNFNFVTIPTFLVYLGFIFFCLEKILEFSEKKISNYFLIVSLFYFILKFTRLSEYGNDIPSNLFSILSIFYFLKFTETNKIKEQKNIFFFHIIFTIFAILIKFSCIPIIILSIYLFIKNYKKLVKEIFRKEFILIYVLSLLFFIQQFFYTGCLIFPSKFSCFNVSWFNEEFLLMRENLEIINKSFSSSRGLVPREDYLANFNWFPFWLKRNYPEILEHVFTMIIPIILLFLFSNKDRNKNYFKFDNQKIFVFFLIASFIFWLRFSPVYRFSIPYFLSLIFIITLSFYRYKKFSKKTFIFIFFIAIVFNFSKNISRLYKKDDIFFGIEKINNGFLVVQSSNNDFIEVNKPDTKNNKTGWQGRLCWDIPFICTYREIKVNKKNGYLFFSKLKN